MRFPYKPFTLVLFVIFLDACSSGKSAYKHGDYFDAVLTSVQRLRHSPDNKKSKEVLSLSYTAAVEYLENDAQNQINSNAEFKYKSAVVNYERINQLYEEIKTSPGAMKVIPSPVNKYKELTDLKAKAAEEAYNAGIQSMLKNTRDDAKDAFYYFSDANKFSPGYRECIEMIDQAKFNATLKVVVEPATTYNYGWNFEPVLHGYRANQFVRFYTPKEAADQSLKTVDQYLTVVTNNFQENRPTVGRRTETQRDSVKTGEKTVNGQKVPVFQKVTAQLTIFEKTISSHGSINLIVTDGSTRAQINNMELTSDVSWTDSWALYTGDLRAVASGNKKLIEKREQSPGKDYLINQTKRDLDGKLANAISGFYQGY